MRDTHYVRMLAHAVLGDLDEERPSSGIEDAASAEVTVAIRGSVSNIVRQLWIDNAVLTQKVADEIKRQADVIDLDGVIRDTVTREMGRARQNLERMIADQIRKQIERAVAERLGTLPESIAKSVVDRLIHEIWSNQ